MSEIATDLADDLARRPDWTPSIHHSEHQHLLRQAHDCDHSLEPTTPFSRALLLGVPMTADDDPKYDCYIDDVFGSYLAEHAARGEAVVPLVLSLFGRPNDTQESLPRDPLLSVKKFLAEARSSELKVVLGWLIDTRRFLISLPLDKFTAWTISLTILATEPRVSRELLRTTLGRLNHAAYVVPLSRHFLGRLYEALAVANVSGRSNCSWPRSGTSSSRSPSCKLHTTDSASTTSRSVRCSA